MGYLDKPQITSGLWSLADQGVVSLGNFLTNILLARTLLQSEYGAYAILLGVLVVIYGTHGAIVTYPLLLCGSTSDSLDRYRSLIIFSIWLTVGLGIALSAPAIMVCGVVGRPALRPWIVAAMFSWIIQETLRRGLMARMRFGGAFLGDAISYVGQAVLIFILARRGRLSLEGAFGAMAVTSLIAAGLQAAQIGIRSLRLEQTRALWKRFWTLGRWMVLSNFTAIFSVQFFPWTLAVLQGTAVAGSFQALSNVVGVTNPVLIGVTNLVIPASAKAGHEFGKKGAFREAVRHGIYGAFIVFPYLVFAAFWPHRILSMLYGRGSGYASLTLALRVFVAAQMVYYVALISASFLNALGRSRTTFSILVVSALVSVVIGVPLMIWMGLLGAVATMALGILIRAVLIWFAMRKGDLEVPADELPSVENRSSLRAVADEVSSGPPFV
jgi:O-antigen/teichoic acid export membrane protein